MLVAIICGMVFSSFGQGTRNFSVLEPNYDQPENYFRKKKKKKKNDLTQVRK